jgi:Na+/proline symporter
MQLLWAVVIIYLVASIIAGVVSQRREKQKSMGGYFHSDISPMVMAFTLVGGLVSGVQVVGIPSTVSTTGVGFWLAGNGGGLLGIFLANFLIGKPMRKMAETRSSITMTDMVTDIYQSNTLRYIAIPAILVWSIAFTTSQWVSLGNLSALLLGVGYKEAVLVGALVVGIYSVLGGTKGTAIVSAMQMMVAMFACVLIIGIALNVSGGLTNLSNDVMAIDPDYMKLASGKYGSMWSFVSFLVIYGIGFLGQPQLISKYFQLKDTKLLPKALGLAVFSTIPLQLIGLVGLTILVKLNTGEMAPLARSDSAMSAFIMQYSNPLVGGLMVAACLAAIMTTIAVLLMTAAGSLVNDIMAKWMKIDMSGKKGLVYSRLGVLAITVISVYFAMDPTGNTFQLGSNAYGGFAAVFMPTIVASLRWRRSTKQGAFWSMLLGFAVVVIPSALDIAGVWRWPFRLHVAVFGMIVSTVAMIVVSLLTPAQEKPFLPPTIKQLRDNAQAV